MNSVRATTEAYAGPNWTDDHLESSLRPEIKPPYFDEKLGAWVLSRYADVFAALQSPNLIPTDATCTVRTVPETNSRLKMRAETKAALSLKHLREWQEALAPRVSVGVHNLPIGERVDLVNDFARPLCLSFAQIVTRVDPGDAYHLRELAQQVSAAAAEPYDPEIVFRARAAHSQLRPCFQTGPESLRSSGFTALSMTLPCLLANAWFGLLQQPKQWEHLHQRPALIGKAIEELFRYAGLTRLLFRFAADDLSLNGIQIRKSDRVILRVIAANRDPKRFPHPNQIEWMRQGKGHLSLGAGPHACLGANLIRMAAITVTRPLIERFAQAKIDGRIETHGGPIFRSPASLPVLLYESPVARSPLRQH